MLHFSSSNKSITVASQAMPVRKKTFILASHCWSIFSKLLAATCLVSFFLVRVHCRCSVLIVRYIPRRASRKSAHRLHAAMSFQVSMVNIFRPSSSSSSSTAVPQNLQRCLTRVISLQLFHSAVEDRFSVFFQQRTVSRIGSADFVPDDPVVLHEG